MSELNDPNNYNSTETNTSYININEDLNQENINYIQSNQVSESPIRTDPVFSSKLNADRLKSEMNKIFHLVESHAMDSRISYKSLSNKCLSDLLNYKKVLFSIGSSNDVNEIQILNLVAKDMLMSYTKCYKQMYNQKNKL
jgi:hypothetical protein